MKNMNKKINRYCPVCNSKESEEIHFQKIMLFDSHPLSGGFPVICCDFCGFVYADIKLTQNELDLYYKEQSKYEDKNIGTGGGESITDLKRLKDTAVCIRYHLEDKNDASVLDIGCANGGLLSELKMLGYSDLVGVDPAIGCVKNTSSRGDLKSFQGSLFNLPGNIGTYDMVVLCHVFEHVLDLETAIGNISTCLNDDGMVYVEIPDANKFYETANSPFQEFNSEHINYFSLLTLENLFKKNGFIMVDGDTKKFETTGGNYCWAAYGFFKKPEKSFIKKIIKDKEILDNINKYVDASNVELEKVNNLLRSFVEKNKTFTIWGAGQLAMKLLAEDYMINADIKAIYDNNPINNGKKINGISVMLPEKAIENDLPIVITSIIHKDVIKDFIRTKLCLKNELFFLN